MAPRLSIANDLQDVFVSTPPLPRRDFRVLTQRRGGYQGATMYDVQLQVAATGSLVWAQTFTDEKQGDEFLADLEADLDTMEDEPFRKKYSVPRSA